MPRGRKSKATLLAEAMAKVALTPPISSPWGDNASEDMSMPAMTEVKKIMSASKSKVKEQPLLRESTKSATPPIKRLVEINPKQLNELLEEKTNECLGGLRFFSQMPVNEGSPYASLQQIHVELIQAEIED